MRVATVEISILQVLLDTERQSYTSNANLEKELVCLQHSYSKLSDIARDLALMLQGYFVLSPQMIQFISLVLGCYAG